MNASNSGVKRSRAKVMVGSNMPKNALFNLAVVTCWWRHSSRQNHNHHLVLVVISLLSMKAAMVIKSATV